MEANLKLKKFDESEKEKLQSIYQQAVGSLIYLMTGARTDLSFVVSLLSQFRYKPGEEHWGALKRAIRYLSGSCFTGLCYLVSLQKQVLLNRFSDANWGNHFNDRSSNSGFVFFIEDCCVSWNSHKQRCVARSSPEAEYVALSECARSYLAETVTQRAGFSANHTNQVL